MAVHLQMVVWSAVLCFLQTFTYGPGYAAKLGPGPLFGNREGFPQLEGWVGRAQRAHRNMLESLPVFAALVFAAHLMDRVDAGVVLGTQLFFYARVAFVVVYIAGITYLRTLVWAAGVAGMAMVAWPLLGSVPAS